MFWSQRALTCLSADRVYTMYTTLCSLCSKPPKMKKGSQRTLTCLSADRVYTKNTTLWSKPISLLTLCALCGSLRPLRSKKVSQRKRKGHAEDAKFSSCIIIFHTAQLSKVQKPNLTAYPFIRESLKYLLGDISLDLSLSINHLQMF